MTRYVHSCAVEKPSSEVNRNKDIERIRFLEEAWAIGSKITFYYLDVVRDIPKERILKRNQNLGPPNVPKSADQLESELNKCFNLIRSHKMMSFAYTTIWVERTNRIRYSKNGSSTRLYDSFDSALNPSSAALHN